MASRILTLAATCFAALATMGQSTPITAEMQASVGKRLAMLEGALRSWPCPELKGADANALGIIRQVYPDSACATSDEVEAAKRVVAARAGILARGDASFACHAYVGRYLATPDSGPEREVWRYVISSCQADHRAGLTPGAIRACWQRYAPDAAAARFRLEELGNKYYGITEKYMELEKELRAGAPNLSKVVTKGRCVAGDYNDWD